MNLGSMPRRVALALTGVLALALTIVPTTASWTGATTFIGTVGATASSEPVSGDWVLGRVTDGQFYTDLGPAWMAYHGDDPTLDGDYWYNSAQNLYVLAPSGRVPSGSMGGFNLAVPDGIVTSYLNHIIAVPGTAQIADVTASVNNVAAGYSVFQIRTGWYLEGNVAYGVAPASIPLFTMVVSIDVYLTWVDGQPNMVTATGSVTVSGWQTPGSGGAVTGQDAGNDVDSSLGGLEIAAAGGAGEREFSSELSGVTAGLAPEQGESVDDNPASHRATIDLYVRGTHLRNDSNLVVEATSDDSPVEARVVLGADGALAQVEGEDFYRMTVEVEVPGDAGVTDASELPLDLRLTAFTPLGAGADVDVWSASATLNGSVSHPGVEDAQDAEDTDDTEGADDAGNAAPGDGTDTEPENDGTETDADGADVDPDVDEPATEDGTESENGESDGAGPGDEADAAAPPVVEPPVVDPEPAPEPAPEPDPAPEPEVQEPLEPQPEVQEPEPEDAVSDAHDCHSCPDCADGDCEHCDDPSCTAREDEPALKTDDEEEVTS